MPTMDILDRLHDALIRALREDGRDPYGRPVTVAEVYQDLVPYRLIRSDLAFEMNADYEHTVLRLLAGERNLAELEPAEARSELAEELESPNPNVGLFRKFAGCDVRLRRGAHPEGQGAPAPEEAAAGSPSEPSAAPDDALDEGGEGERADVHRAAAAAERGAVGEAASMPAPADAVSAQPAEEGQQSGSARARARAATATAAGTVEETGTAAEAARPEEADAPEDAGTAQKAAAPQEAPAAFPDWAGLEEQSAEAAVARLAELPVPSAAGQDVELPRCGYCDEDLPAARAVRYCPFCGGDQTRRPCPSCGEALDRAWRYCISCGTRAGGRAS